MKLRKKYSLTAQLAEAKRELAIREGFYPSQVHAHRMRAEEAEMHLDLQRNIIATLEWMKEHETTVKAAVARKTGASA